MDLTNTVTETLKPLVVRIDFHRGLCGASVPTLLEGSPDESFLESGL